MDYRESHHSSQIHRIHVNILHINHNFLFIQFLYKPLKTEFSIEFV
jgi:hypothetical protein